MSNSTEPLTTQQTLANLVEYQAGSVISRTLLKRPSGSLTMFAFDAGQGLSEHTTPHDAVVQILDGTARVTVGGDTQELSPGEALQLPAHVPHALTAVSPFKMLLIMIRST